MSGLTFSQIEVGMSAAFSVTVTQGMVDSFRALSGDTNPLHSDDGFARARGFGGAVAHGLLVSSFYSTLAGVHLPGENCLLQEVSTQFVRPVFVGDTLRVSGTVAEKNESVRQIVLKARIVNQNGEKVNRAKIKAGVLA